MYREECGLSQEACASALGLRSKSYISEIETGAKPASLRLALKIERWSGGRVSASSISPAAREIAQQDAAA
jgi:DNA-binding XRE family transcriptional regulator